MTIDTATWLLAVLSLAGTILNVRKRWEGFALWIVANTGWIFVNLEKGIPAQALLFVAYLGVSAWGLYSWKFRASPAEAATGGKPPQ